MPFFPVTFKRAPQTWAIVFLNVESHTQKTSMTQIEIKLDMHYLNRVEWVWFESQPTSKNTTIMQTLIWQRI